MDKIIGTQNERALQPLRLIVEDINTFEPDISRLSDQELKAKTDEFKDRFANPFVAAEHGFVDDVVEPRETRRHVIRALRLLETKVDTMPRKKHGNIPL